MTSEWANLQDLTGVSYVCGYCSNRVGPGRGYYSTSSSHHTEFGRVFTHAIYICTLCRKPTFIEWQSSLSFRQYPGSLFGDSVQHLPPEVERVYNEARACMSVSAYTSSVLSCRKLLMYIGASLGADGNKNFQYYVNYLADNGHIPPQAKNWVDHIRVKGNEATHELTDMSKDDAEELLSFMEMLLKLVYEFPQRIKAK